MSVRYPEKIPASIRTSCERCGELMSSVSNGERLCLSCRQERRQERCEAILKYREEGLSVREMAMRLELSEQTIGTMISEMRQAGWEIPTRKARIDRRSYGDCERCGKAMKGHNPPSQMICQTCRSERKREKWELIEQGWNEGMTIPEIAEALEISDANVSALINQARKAGYNIPYRSERYR